jgi:hypothetical protein
MQFSPEAFNRFLGPNGNIGQQYAWYASTRCPCVDPNSGAANPACPLCFGKGRQYSPFVQGVAGISGQSAQRAWFQFGNYEQGDLVVTIPSDSPVYNMGQYDRVTALNTQQVFSLVLTSGDLLERIHTSVLSITKVYWLIDDGATVQPGGIPVVNPVDGTLSWPNGGQPPAGVQYSITGTKMLDYYCWGNFPSNRNFQQGLALPRKVVLRDYDLFNR